MGNPPTSRKSTKAAKAEWFGPTSWTLIYMARDGDMPERREALEQLCRTYWYPLYAFVRRQGHGPADAEDLTQSFFFQLLERNFLGAIDRRKGKFRSFLLVSLKHFLENQRQYRNAAKRGGGKVILSLDEFVEDQFSQEPATEATPEAQFDRDWAAALLARVQARLKTDYSGTGKSKLFTRLKKFLAQEATMDDYRGLAGVLDMSTNAVAVAVHRLRQKYRDLLREEIGQTVASPDDVSREMRHVLEIVSLRGSAE